MRVTFDAVGMGMFTLRTKYEHGQRRGKGIEEGERIWWRSASSRACANSTSRRATAIA